jgi:mono/diheme cytochrome c family protein
VSDEIGDQDGIRALLVAVAITAIAVASAFGVSRLVRHQALRASTQIPTPEAWVLDPAEASSISAHEGRKLFLSSCAHCHGADATGDEGPDLHGIEASDRYVANTILRGIKGEMPSFKKKFKPADVVRLTAYLRSLG